MKTLILTRDERTQAILDNFRGLEGEFYMLKGILCMDGACDKGAKNKGGDIHERSAERNQFSETFNSMMIAERMDELRTVLRNEDKPMRIKLTSACGLDGVEIR